jgi:hypothetical protein
MVKAILTWFRLLRPPPQTTRQRMLEAKLVERLAEEIAEE